MKRRHLLIVLMMVLVFAGEIFSCTNFIVTKGASTNGSTMITYSADSYNLYGELYHWRAGVYPAGTMLDIYEWDTAKYLGKIKQAAQTYNVVGNMNEFQLAIGETTFGGREELSNSKGIMDYGSLIYVTLQRAKTAREAIKIMSELVEEYGYYSSGESFSIADPNEAWIMELIGKGEGVKGANWVAIRIPDGYVSGHANQARITTFPLNDPQNCLYSKDVITFAKSKGYFNGKDEEFSFADAYAPLDFGAVRFCDARVWSLFRRVNKTMDKYIDYIEAKTNERMPLYIKPDNKLSLQDVMGLMRDHYEGTPLDMTKGVAAGAFASPYRWRPLTFNYNGENYFNERPISTPQTGFSFVSQSRSSMPNEIGGVLWFGVDDTYMTVYNPVYTSSTSVQKNYGTGVANLGTFNWESVFWVFNFVSNLTYPSYSKMIGDVKNEQNKLEGLFISQQEKIENTALAYYKESKGKAVDYLTNYSKEMCEHTYSSWKKLGEFLVMKYMDGVVKNEYAQPLSKGYPEEFKKRIVEENGAYFKVRQMPGEAERNYAEIITKADEALAAKKYDTAKKEYEKALKIKQDETVKAKVKKIENILSELEKLHTKEFAN